MDHTPLAADKFNSSASSLLPTLTSPPTPHPSPRRRALLAVAVLCLIAAAVIIPPIIYLRATRTPDPPPFSPYTTCDIFCTGPILSAFQLAGLWNDSKTFVDFSLRADPSDVYRDFLAIGNVTTAALVAFLEQHFDTNSSDLLPWALPDWQPSPPALSVIVDSHFYNFSSQLNSLWYILGRQVHPDVYAHPDRHTLLPLEQPYMVVPGGRFREFYYWDSYWIIRGLLLCGMQTTARIVIDNLLWMVRQFGFVPNGSRQYYLTRSQPPFLALMVDYYHDTAPNLTWVAAVLPTLDAEYTYWMTPGKHAVSVVDSTNRTWTLNRYFASVQYPRPEAYAEDVATAHELARYSPTNCTDNPDCDTSDQWSRAAKHLFSELTAVAETGWDFSSRWFADRRNISSAETTNIIPVDLNAVLFQVERVLAKLHAQAGNSTQAAAYQRAADTRLDAIHAVLFDGSAGRGHHVWRDFDYVAGVLDGDTSVLSNYLPLWTHAYDDRVNASLVIDGLLHSGLVQSGGLLTSLDQIDQQWDCPNAWPPLQHMIFEGIATAQYFPANASLQANLDALNASLSGPLPAPYVPVGEGVGEGTVAGKALAYYLSSSWLYGNLQLFNSTGIMFEKYYALERGKEGAGGEYEVQKGFGWTNGVALILLEQYGAVLNWDTVQQQGAPMRIDPDHPCSIHPDKPAYRRRR